MIVSLDGYIEGPKGELDWFEDGDPDFERYCDEMIDSVGLALYGRRSYELMLSYWPNAETNPQSAADLAFARKMNTLPKLVLSRTLERAEWNNTRICLEVARGCSVGPRRASVCGAHPRVRHAWHVVRRRAEPTRLALPRRVEPVDRSGTPPPL